MVPDVPVREASPIHDRSSSRGPPDLVVVVLDCVRAQDLPGGDRPLPGMDELARLRAAGQSFSRTVSPCPWTLPSHTSLLTGLYPFEHGVHATGRLHLDPGLATLPARLRPRGYRSVLVSASTLLSRTTGFARDFDAAYWGEWWETYARFPTHWKPFGSTPAGRALPSLLGRLRGRPGVWRVLTELSPVLLRYVFLLDLATRLALRLRGSDARARGRVAPWVESTLARWLAGPGAKGPVLALVNLLDAHEPYLSDPDVVRTFAEWRRFARLRQDRLGWLRGDFVPDPEELALLEELYRHAVRGLDARLRGIREVLERAGRWDRTLLAVTSDHGQAFGEGHVLFHMLGLEEVLLRVPLLLRPPTDGSVVLPSHGAATSWTSLVDLAPTFCDAAGVPRLGGEGARSLLDPAGRGAEDPVLAVTDGSGGELHGILEGTEGRPDARGLQAAVYAAERKVVVGEGGSAIAFDLRRDPSARAPLDPDADGPDGRMVEAARRALRRMRAARGPSGGREGPSLDGHLRAWGYL